MSYGHSAIASAEQVILNQRTKPDHSLKIWQRLLIATALAIGLSASGFCFWIVGILMFTFALDGANSQQLPSWLDAFMLVGWPISIGAVVLIGPALVATGFKWWQSLTAFITTALISAGVYMTGVIALVSSLQ